MQKLFFLFFSVILSLSLCSIDSMAQTYIDVEPGVGTLNNAIANDTRPESDRNYRLKRGDQAYYLLTGSISNIGYHLTIVAEDGAGARPFLQPLTPTGGESSRAFRPKGDLTLKGLHITGIDDLGGFPLRIIYGNADSIRLDIEDCWLDGDAQSAFRVGNEGMSIIARNSIISNIGQPSDPNNGRGIDDRGNNMDTVIIENCTFFNLTSRIIRDAGGWIKYCRFTNNTAVNIAQFGVSFGEVGFLDMKDNLFMNASFFPTTPDPDDDPYYVIGTEYIGTELENMGITQEVNISNNSFWLDTAQLQPYLAERAVVSSLFNQPAQAFVTAGGKEATILDEKVDFANGPPFHDLMLYHHFEPGQVPLETPPLPIPSIPYGKFWHTVMYYDLDYIGNLTITGASDGGHLGDPRWDATLDPTINVSSLQYNSSGLSVFPVPIDEHANIHFTLKGDANVSITVYNIVGQRVSAIADARFPSGENIISWNAGLLKSGMYVMQMNIGNEVSTLKFLKK